MYLSSWIIIEIKKKSKKTKHVLKSILLLKLVFIKGKYKSRILLALANMIPETFRINKLKKLKSQMLINFGVVYLEITVLKLNSYNKL